MSRELRYEALERRRERELLERKKEEFAMDIRAVAGTAEGLRIFRWLLERGGFLRDDYQPGVAGAYAAGRKSVALELVDRLRRSLPRDLFVSIVFPDMADGEGDVSGESARENVVVFPEDELVW